MAQRLEGLSHPAVQLDPSGRAEFVVDRVADEGVDEGEPAGSALDLPHQSGLARLGQCLDHRGAVQGGQGAEHGHVELAADHRPQREQPVDGLGQAGEAAPDHLPYAVRNPGDFSPERPPVSLLDQLARFDEVPQELAHEERAAVGLGIHGVGQGELAALQVVAGQGLHHGHGLAVGEAPQAEPLDAALPAQLGQQVGERMASADVGVAVGPDDEQGHRLAGADHVFEHQQRGLGGPVEVVEQEHDRPPA